MAQTLPPLLRLPAVLNLFPVSRSTWYEGVKVGRYPSPVRLGPASVAWRGADIQRLLDEGVTCAATQQSAPVASRTDAVRDVGRDAPSSASPRSDAVKPRARLARAHTAMQAAALRTRAQATARHGAVTVGKR